MISRSPCLVSFADEDLGGQRSCWLRLRVLPLLSGNLHLLGDETEAGSQGGNLTTASVDGSWTQWALSSINPLKRKPRWGDSGGVSRPVDKLSWGCVWAEFSSVGSWDGAAVIPRARGVQRKEPMAELQGAARVVVFGGHQR